MLKKINKSFGTSGMDVHRAFKSYYTILALIKNNSIENARTIKKTDIVKYSSHHYSVLYLLFIFTIYIDKFIRMQ